LAQSARPDRAPHSVSNAKLRKKIFSTLEGFRFSDGGEFRCYEFIRDFLTLITAEGVTSEPETISLLTQTNNGRINNRTRTIPPHTKFESLRLKAVFTSAANPYR